MYDGIGANAGWIARNLPAPDLIACYDTGSSDIVWSASDRALFPRSVKVTIDQGGVGSPTPASVVRDVEPGAWNPWRAVNDRPWTAVRPTIYCSRDTIPDVLNAGWRGDLWIAWPGYTAGHPPSVPGCTVVAVQNMFLSNYDQSSVFDDFWPFLPPKAGEMIYDTINTGEARTIPFPAGAFTRVTFAHDFTNATTAFTLRVAIRSALTGYVVHNVTVDRNGPVVLPFTAHDTDAVSIVNKTGPNNVGITIS